MIGHNSKIGRVRNTLIDKIIRIFTFVLSIGNDMKIRINYICLQLLKLF